MHIREYLYFFHLLNFTLWNGMRRLTVSSAHLRSVVFPFAHPVNIIILNCGHKNYCIFPRFLVSVAITSLSPYSWKTNDFDSHYFAFVVSIRNMLLFSRLMCVLRMLVELTESLLNCKKKQNEKYMFHGRNQQHRKKQAK